MKLRCCLALCVMLATALGRVKEKQQNTLRSQEPCESRGLIIGYTPG